MFNPLNETANEIKTERITLNDLHTKAWVFHTCFASGLLGDNYTPNMQRMVLSY